MLGEVGVLILIYKNILEKLLIVSAHIGMITKKFIHVEEYVIEIHRVGTMTSVPIYFVNLSDHGSFGPFVGIIILFCAQILLRCDHRIFGI